MITSFGEVKNITPWSALEAARAAPPETPQQPPCWHCAKTSALQSTFSVPSSRHFLHCVRLVSLPAGGPSAAPRRSLFPRMLLGVSCDHPALLLAPARSLDWARSCYIITGVWGRAGGVMVGEGEYGGRGGDRGDVSGWSCTKLLVLA